MYIEEVDFKTVIEGNLPETSFGLTIRTISLFLIDDLTSWADDPSTVIQPSKSDRNRGHALWKVSSISVMLGSLS